jgi:hypothetical protein
VTACFVRLNNWKEKEKESFLVGSLNFCQRFEIQ